MLEISNLIGKQMIEVVKERVEEYPELEELRINLFNKDLYYRRSIESGAGF